MVQLVPMRYFTAIISLIFVGVAVFGFAFVCHGGMMGDSMNSSNMNCNFSMLADCAAPGLQMAIHHISAYQSFSNVTVFSLFAFLAASFVLSAFVLSFTKKNSSAIFAPAFTFPNNRWRENLQTTPRSQKFSNWLSLFENSPSFA